MDILTIAMRKIDAALFQLHLPNVKLVRCDFLNYFCIYPTMEVFR